VLAATRVGRPWCLNAASRATPGFPRQISGRLRLSPESGSRFERRRGPRWANWRLAPVPGQSCWRARFVVRVRFFVTPAAGAHDRAVSALGREASSQSAGARSPPHRLPVPGNSRQGLAPRTPGRLGRHRVALDQNNDELVIHTTFTGCHSCDTRFGPHAERRR
jgi:hypothetical protein